MLLVQWIPAVRALRIPGAYPCRNLPQYSRGCSPGIPNHLNFHRHFSPVSSVSAREASSSRARPTHFISLRLPSPVLHKLLADTQDHIIEQDRTLLGCNVPPKKTHITGFVMTLADDTWQQRACAALSECDDLVDGGPAPCIHLQGLGKFGDGRVLYASIEKGPELDRVSKLIAGVKGVFEERGLISNEGRRPWKPHVTVLKTSRSRERVKPKILPSCYAGLESLDFGTHELNTIELCAMRGLGPDGFYPVLKEVRLDRLSKS